MYQETQTNQTLAKSKSFEFKWDKNWFQKRHWILIIGLACLVFWYFAPQLKTWPWLQSTLNLLPVLGGLALSLDAIVKLAD